MAAASSDARRRFHSLYEQERDCIPESLQTTTWEKMAESAKTWKPCEDMSA